MNKFIITQLDKLIMTKDTGLMCKELDIHHPAARLVTNASRTQELEMGDATNLVLSFAGELLSNAEELIKNGLHISEILKGFRLAYELSDKLLDQQKEYILSDLTNQDEVTKVLKSSISTKCSQGQHEIIGPLISQACISILPKDPLKFNHENIRTQKVLGGSIFDSEVIRGLVVMRLIEGSVSKAEKCKVAVYNCPLETQDSETQSTVLIKSAEELLNYTKGEENHIETIVKTIVDSGVKCVIAGGSVSDLAVHYFDKYNIMVFRVMSKFEIRRIAQAVGATMLVRLGAPTEEEIGYADSIRVDEVADTKCIIIERNQDGNELSTIILRGSTVSVIENMEKIVEEGVNAYKCLCKSQVYVPGAGATEMSIALAVKSHALKEKGIHSYAVSKFGEAFEVIPRYLIENSGKNSNELMAKLISANSKEPSTGVNLLKGEVQDAYELGVYDHKETKRWALKFAVDAVLTVLKVDQIILSKPAGGPSFKKPEGMFQGEDDDF